MKRIGQWALLWVLALATAGYLAFWPSGAMQTAGPMDSGRPVLVLDAGHGGEDGGAVSLTGVPESQINLAIVQKLDLLLGLCGQSPVVLRQEDVSLHDPSADTLREKKASDLKNRVAMVEGTEKGVLLSIHQNMFTDAKYHGAQVFYAPTQGSQEFAVFTQEVLRQAVDQANERQAKPIPDTVYLMNHITRPAILVECGFLSNPEEEGKLRSEGYQLQLAAALAGAWLQYSEELGDMR
ncbi:N-acetylmuramoyl-L-alanine amidase [Flavonifractor plautii]|uniref:N-acetylmuramoyl-L-alanine amidase n=1 Tax=Flavonifractor plautii TaxID=292800 RepID=UPI00195CF855|nr:N-acetylmuramoyl-L-alanine amidase [Flavonifractor plautii]MBM6665210.1 N-acetylmuramoyl-L-alanine amidase [Flavonifractor plautii]